MAKTNSQPGPAIGVGVCGSAVSQALLYPYSMVAHTTVAMTPTAKIGNRKALTFSSQTRTPPTASGIAHAVTIAYQSWTGPPNCACAATASTDPSNTANHVPVRASASVAIAAPR